MHLCPRLGNDGRTSREPSALYSVFHLAYCSFPVLALLATDCRVENMHDVLMLSELIEKGFCIHAKYSVTFCCSTHVPYMSKTLIMP